MELTQYKLVNTQGLKGLHYKGDFIPFDSIDDKLAGQLYGKTHVLERIEPEPTGTTPLVLALTEPAATESAAAEAEDPDKKKE